MKYLVALVTEGLLIMPDKYRRLVNSNGEIKQSGCPGTDRSSLFEEVKDLSEWKQENVFRYKIRTMLRNYGKRSR
jgi:hypothetical protein